MGALKTTARVLACLLLFGQARAYALTLTLAWDPSTDPHVVGYLLSYGTAPGSYTTQLDAGNSSSIVVANLDDHTTYYFTIQSYDIGQAHVSARSTEVVYSPLSVMCLNASGSSNDGNPVAVSIPAPLVSGAAPPLTVSCSPASGSAFPIGSTSFVCSVMDVVTAASCTGTVTVADNSGGGGGGGGGNGGGGGGGSTSGGGSSSGGGSPAPSDPAPANNGGGSAPAPEVVADGPVYETPPPPGAFGFSDHGYFRPDGGWQETRRLSMGGGGGTAIRAIAGGGGCVPTAGVPLYEMPAPPGSSGFSDHGYYRPDGGWQETRQIGAASGSTCVPYVGSSGASVTTPSSPSIAAMPSDYDTPPPPGSYGFSDRGYFRPDGGWQSANRQRTGGVAVYSGSPAPAAAVTGGSSSGTASSMAYGSGGSVTYASAPTPAPSAYIQAPAPRATTSAIAPINLPSPTPEPAPAAPVQINVPAPAARMERSGQVSAVRQPEQRAISVGVMLRRPAAPANATPVDTSLTPRSFDASWSADPNAESYDIYLGVNSEPPLFKSGVASSVVHIQGLAPNTTYYWRVVARNGAGETASGTWTFTTRER